MHTEKVLRAEYAYYLLSLSGCTVNSNVMARVLYFFLENLFFSMAALINPMLFRSHGICNSRLFVLLPMRFLAEHGYSSKMTNLPTVLVLLLHQFVLGCTLMAGTLRGCEDKGTMTQSLLSTWL